MPAVIIGAVTGDPRPAVCWHCAQPSDDNKTCKWCGVWLIELDPERVPLAARPLLGLARRWGIPDDGYRSDAVAGASRDELEEIIRALREADADDEVARWLISEADAPPSPEYLAITCLTMAADDARLRLAERVRAGSVTDDGAGDVAGASPAGDGSDATWPVDLLNALRLGQRLVAEVPAGPGRRAFVDITPVTDDRDRRAEREGWRRSDPHRAFHVQHWDYDAQNIDGWDYDVGVRLVRSATAESEAALLELITSWGLRPTDFAYPWKTADPR